MHVAVLTSSYPRAPGDIAGLFVADAVERLRASGVEIEVVSPATFRHFGVAYGHGVLGNLRAKPWLAAAVPPMLASYALAARRAARHADLLHAHWLPSGAVALAAGRPFVVQLWGSDVALARRAPALARAVLRRARATICPSTALADEARRLGATRVHVIPSGVDVPEDVPPSAEPPSILYAGRLSAEKGILELVEAARGLPLTVVGDGPLRASVAEATGFVPHDVLTRYYADTAIVACPSRREGFGVVCAEAMAHGRPVVATAVGGHLDLVVDGETGLLVPPGDVVALRAALERLLGDGELRRRLGAAARERARARFSWEKVTAETIAVYEAALTESSHRSARMAP